MERVWGGRELENVYHRTLPKADTPYGESWEMSDREEAQSVVRTGTYSGKTLNDLWMNHREELFGDNLHGDRFPLLIKILDARNKLSVQVHPPEEQTKLLGGEAKTEMWYIADADPEAKIYVGLKPGVTRESFEQAIKAGRCEDEVHSIEPRPGESIHIPSGRLHAIGAGLLIYEIQQNSDTTFRVYDWNRLGLNGKPRDLHIEESLQCINFNDHAPTMDTPNDHTLAECPHYRVEQFQFTHAGNLENRTHDRFSIITVVAGKLTDTTGTSYLSGTFFLLPRGADALRASEGTKVLQTTLPRNWTA